MSGVGSAASPFVVTSVGGSGGGSASTLTVSDTTTVNLTMTGSGTTIDPRVLSADATLKLAQLADVNNPDGLPVAGDVPVYVGSGTSGHWEFAPGSTSIGGGSSTNTGYLLLADGAAIPSGTPVGTIVIRTAVSAAPGAPTKVGYVTSTSGGVTATNSITLTPAGTILTNDWMIAVIGINAPTNPSQTITTPSGWTEITSDWFGTFKIKIYAHKRAVGESTYTFTISGAAAHLTSALMWIRGAASVGSWLAGPMKDRASAPASTTVNKLLSVTTTVANTLVLGLSTERTSVTETGVASVTGATGWFFHAQVNANASGTIWAGSNVMATAGTSPEINVTYPNADAVNGWGYQIAIPPA